MMMDDCREKLFLLIFAFFCRVLCILRLKKRYGYFKEKNIGFNRTTAKFKNCPFYKNWKMCCSLRVKNIESSESVGRLEKNRICLLSIDVCFTFDTP